MVKFYIYDIITHVFLHSECFYRIEVQGLMCATLIVTIRLNMCRIFICSVIAIMICLEFHVLAYHLCFKCNFVKLFL